MPGMLSESLAFHRWWWLLYSPEKGSQAASHHVSHSSSSESVTSSSTDSSSETSDLWQPHWFYLCLSWPKLKNGCFDYLFCFICGKIKLPISLKQCGFLNLSLYKSQYPSAAVSYHAMNPQLSWRPDAGASTNILFLSFCPYSLITAWALFTHRRRTAREWVCETRCTRLQT